MHVRNLRDAAGSIPGASLTVVGDSDQSIYAFRGADTRNISEFERDFPGTQVILLEQNYRSTQNILSAANAVIGHNFDRKDKKLWSAGGAGEKIRRKLLETCDVHTVLRLPTGIFYAQGVKANVVFFDAKPKDGRIPTQGVWFYDLRTNKHFTLKTRTLKLDDLQDFIACYNPENRHQRVANERFKLFSYDELMARDKASLDIFWLKDDSLDNLDEIPPPDVLQQEIIEHLESALESFRSVAVGLRAK